MERNGGFRPVAAVCVLIMALYGSAGAQYGGGTGEPNDPYLIYTPEQMNAIGADPNDWDNHFKLMADIDLSEYTGTEFNLIGSAWSIRRPRSVGDLTLFVGVFDGNGHNISNFTYASKGETRIGLFRRIDDPNAQIKDLGLVNPNIDVEEGDEVGSLVGYFGLGLVTNCYASGGVVAGGRSVGGLIGYGGEGWSTDASRITGCYATATVIGDFWVGGLVGSAGGVITNCYAMGVVLGGEEIGGLVGQNGAEITNCYAAGAVLGDWAVGGLAGGRDPREAVASFWDVQASRQPTGVCGEGKTTAQMQAILTYRAWGEGDDAGIWTIDEGNDYPRLAWEHRSGIVIEALEFVDLLHGAGTADDPYLIYTVDDMELIAGDPNEWGRHFKLMADLDLSAHPGVGFNTGGPDYLFSGVFDGNGHTISNFTHVSKWYYPAGFFGRVEDPCVYRTRGSPECDPNAGPVVIKDLGLLNPVVDGRQEGSAGALIGFLGSATVSNCYVQGGLVLGAGEETGGLVGYSRGLIVECHTFGGTVRGTVRTGGLVGGNWGDMANCYSTVTVMGTARVGGLVGGNGGSVTNCYAAGTVVGDWSVGGLVGADHAEEIVASFWDVETSGQTTSAGGTGLTTAEMQTAAPFLEAGWDFVDEVENGEEDLWSMTEGDYPRLAWELEEVPVPVVEVIELDATNFSETIANGVVLVDFYATWCPHCTEQAPILDEVAVLVSELALVAKLDVDEARSVAQAYGVSAVPNLIVFRNGEVFERFLGVTQASTLVAAIERALDPQAPAP